LQPENHYTYLPWMWLDELGCDTCSRSYWEKDREESERMKPYNLIQRSEDGYVFLYQCSVCGAFYRLEPESRRQVYGSCRWEDARREFPRAHLVPGRCEPAVVKNGVIEFLKEFFDNKPPSRFRWTDESVEAARKLSGAKKLTTELYSTLKEILNDICVSMPSEGPASSKNPLWPATELSARDQQTGVLYRLQICDFYPIATLRMVAQDGKRIKDDGEVARVTQIKTEYFRILECRSAIFCLAKSALKEEGYCLLLPNEDAFAVSNSRYGLGFATASDYLFGPGAA
jgi:hypothetical protein